MDFIPGQRAIWVRHGPRKHERQQTLVEVLRLKADRVQVRVLVNGRRTWVALAHLRHPDDPAIGQAREVGA